MSVSNSRIAGFFRRSVHERVLDIAERTGLNPSELSDIESGNGLDVGIADKMIENVIGTFPMPAGIATNFIVNGKDYLIPMVVEEPSVVAAASHMAKLCRSTGGFLTSYSGSQMIAQIHVTGVRDPFGARLNVYQHRDELLEMANSYDKTLVSLGGGARDIQVRVIESAGFGPVLAIHLIVDVLDAMGANAVNTMAERLASRIEELTNGKVLLRILSNLADLRVARAHVVVRKDELSTDAYSGEVVVDGIVKAYQIADIDPYRAATHNKGIMNGVDPVVIATGNDWRAIEAGAHAYAARSGRYRSLSTWEKNANGDLVGTLEMPMAVGIVGGATKTHPLAKLCLKILGINQAAELAQIIVAVGLAQNLGALKALSTEGIQRGHMALHARNIALQAHVPASAVDWVISGMVRAKDVRIDKAKELLENWSKEHV